MTSASTVYSIESATHPCLKSVSDACLTAANIFDAFPIPEDPGIWEAFCRTCLEPIVYDNDGVQKFFDLCKALNLAPIMNLKKLLKESVEINLKFYRLQPKLVEPIAEALFHNPTVKSLVLQVINLSKKLFIVTYLYIFRQFCPLEFFQ